MKENIFQKTLKVLRYIYGVFDKREPYSPSDLIKDPNEASDAIYQLLSSDKPCMIARFGGNELTAMINYMGVSGKSHSIVSFIKSESPQWWWNPKSIELLTNNAGFFPATEESLEKFCSLMLEDLKQLDILGSCWESERMVDNLYPQARKVRLHLLEPWFSTNPWTRILKGKRVLVVHPFAKSILSQYKRREKLFKNEETLPEFKSLRIIKAVQSIGGGNADFRDWFEALEWMKGEMDKEPYDVALIGCGAYGFSLAAHAKMTGHQSVHLGGVLQLLFGIKGKRWINNSQDLISSPQSNYYNSIINEEWIFPSKEETPDIAKNIEDACYW